MKNVVFSASQTQNSSHPRALQPIAARFGTMGAVSAPSASLRPVLGHSGKTTVFEFYV